MKIYELSKEEMKGTAAGKKSCNRCWKKIYQVAHPVETKKAVPDCARCILR